MTEGLDKWDWLALAGFVLCVMGFIAADMFHKTEETISFITAERDAAMAALRDLVYEVTHLSPQEDDGSHNARITEPTLTKARAVLAATNTE